MSLEGLANRVSVTYESRFSCILLAACNMAARAICDGAYSRQASVRNVRSSNSSVPGTSRSGSFKEHRV